MKDRSKPTNSRPTLGDNEAKLGLAGQVHEEHRSGHLHLHYTTYSDECQQWTGEKERVMVSGLVTLEGY